MVYTTIGTPHSYLRNTSLGGAYLAVASWASLIRRRGEKWSAACGGSVFFYKPKFPETGSIRYHSSQICERACRLDKIRSFGTIEKA